MSKGEGNRHSKSKCLAYVVAFIIIQAAIILVLALTVFRIRGPKVRFGAIAVDNITSSNTTAPSFNMRLHTQFTVRNTNFGHFRYRNTTLTVLYGGVSVGYANIPSGRARARSTRRTNISVDISSNGLANITNLGSDINSGVLNLTSEARLSGRVHLLRVIKRRKSGVMSCTIAVNLGTGLVQDFRCN